MRYASLTKVSTSFLWQVCITPHSLNLVSFTISPQECRHFSCILLYVLHHNLTSSPWHILSQNEHISICWFFIITLNFSTTLNFFLYPFLLNFFLPSYHLTQPATSAPPSTSSCTLVEPFLFLTFSYPRITWRCNHNLFLFVALNCCFLLVFN